MNEWEWGLLEDKTPVESLSIGGVEVKPGGRVRLRPRKGGDIFDLAMEGKVAIVEAIEQDYEGQFQLAVVLEDDPGRDLGMMRQPGHRFFFSPAEVEPVKSLKILIAGIGNIFLGDDAFGVELAERLAACRFPAGVQVRDFGIRGFDLAFALMDGPEFTILLDACPRSGSPGTVTIIEPNLAGIESAPADAHRMDPMSVLRLALGMGARLNRILLVGCEPEFLGGEEGHMGLSPSVKAAMDGAVKVVESLVQKILNGELN
jgi:hydrogenase maturation protease